MSAESKINQVMASVGKQKKDRTMDQGPKYSYLSAESLIDAIRPAMVEAKLTMVPAAMVILENRDDETSSGKIMHYSRIMVTYRLTDTEAVPEDPHRSCEVMAFGEGGDMGDKVLNKCMTSAEKYALIQTFLIATGDDPDHQASEAAARSERRPTGAGAPTNGAATEAQIGYIARICKEHDVTRETWDRVLKGSAGRVVANAKDLTKAEASAFIEGLKLDLGVS